MNTKAISRSCPFISYVLQEIILVTVKFPILDFFSVKMVLVAFPKCRKKGEYFHQLFHITDSNAKFYRFSPCIFFQIFRFMVLNKCKKCVSTYILKSVTILFLLINSGKIFIWYVASLSESLPFCSSYDSRVNIGPTPWFT